MPRIRRPDRMAEVMGRTALPRPDTLLLEGDITEGLEMDPKEFGITTDRAEFFGHKEAEMGGWGPEALERARKRREDRAAAEKAAAGMGGGAVVETRKMSAKVGTSHSTVNVLVLERSRLIAMVDVLDATIKNLEALGGA